MMIDKINELIDTNLKLICESPNQVIFSHKFVDINNKELTQRYKGVAFSKEMESRTLITILNEKCIVTEFGYNIHQQGGWLKHRKLEKQKAIEKQQNDIAKEKLETELKKLQKEALEYQHTIRQLQEEVEISKLLKNYWWLITSAIGTGGAIGKWLI